MDVLELLTLIIKAIPPVFKTVNLIVKQNPKSKRLGKATKNAAPATRVSDVFSS